MSNPDRELRECGKCGEDYESYTFFITDDFNGLVDRARIEREYGNVCIECRREEMDGRDWGLLEA